MKTAKAVEIAKYIVEEILLKHGAVKEMVSDRDRKVLSNVLKYANYLCQISYLLTIVRHSQNNGLTERFYKTLADMV